MTKPETKPKGSGNLPALILLIILIVVPAVSAVTTVSFSNFNLFANQDVLVYNITASNASLLGTYNTSSTGITLQNDCSYMFTLKPSAAAALNNPVDFLTMAIDWIESNVFALVIILLLILIMVRKR